MVSCYSSRVTRRPKLLHIGLLWSYGLAITGCTPFASPPPPQSSPTPTSVLSPGPVGTPTFVQERPAVVFTSIAFDVPRHQMVLFGGEPTGSTWLFRQGRWMRAKPTVSPLPRYGARMAYEPARAVVVLFGGQAYDRPLHFLADTWTWDGINWVEIRVMTNPPPRSNHAMAYDAKLDAIILVGGLGGPNQHLNDTWKLDNRSWSQVVGLGPGSGFDGGDMAYDAIHQVVILLGADPTEKLDTWIFDTKWTKGATGPSGLPAGNMALGPDPLTGTVVMFGGDRSSGVVGDTWVWDGSTWSRAGSGGAPSPRARAAMAFDAETSKTILVGGGTAFPLSGHPSNETWEWDGRTWRQVA